MCSLVGDDLLFLGKNTLWRLGHDMYRFAQRQTGMTWSDIWEQLTGESLSIQAISVGLDMAYGYKLSYFVVVCYVVTYLD